MLLNNNFIFEKIWKILKVFYKNGETENPSGKLIDFLKIIY